MFLEIEKPPLISTYVCQLPAIIKIMDSNSMKIAHDMYKCISSRLTYKNMTNREIFRLWRSDHYASIFLCMLGWCSTRIHRMFYW